jgi:hypothetical protein
VIARRPREIAFLAAYALALWAALHFLDRIATGFARCPVEGCLPR